VITEGFLSCKLPFQSFAEEAPGIPPEFAEFNLPDSSVSFLPEDMESFTVDNSHDPALERPGK